MLARGLIREFNETELSIYGLHKCEIPAHERDLQGFCPESLPLSGPAVGKGPDNRGRGDPLKKRILPDRSPLLFPLSGRHARSATLLISERTSRTIPPTQLPASPRLFWAPSNVWRSFRILVGQADLLVRESWSYPARST